MTVPWQPKKLSVPPQRESGQVVAVRLLCTHVTPTISQRKAAREVVVNATFVIHADPRPTFRRTVLPRNSLGVAQSVSERKTSTLSLVKRSLSKRRVGTVLTQFVIL